jgi:predicted nuclease of restriction endonuclease-like (RecB) superfamily
MKFPELIHRIQSAHTQLQQQAVKAVNTYLTLRNWLIGCYIVEFEQHGEDRAEYGAKLLVKLASQLKIKGLSAPELSRCRQFYHTYPEMIGSVTPISDSLSANLILGSATQQSLLADQTTQKYYAELLSKVSFTHFVELIKIKDAVKRKFYELMVIKNTLSVRELEKQIATLTYERIGLSGDVEKTAVEFTRKLQPEHPEDAVKSLYIFDFLNLPHQHLLHENQLEEMLLQHLQQFILELGYGFCFEARQKRILIDDDYCFVDLVFYHRVLKCHVLIELKVDKFRHEYLSQLNSYVAYYNDREKLPEDNPTIGILLCAEKGHQMVEYAKAGMTQQLFVSKYQVQLPAKEQLLQFIENELKHL